MTDMMEAITKGLSKSSTSEAPGNALHALSRLFVVCASGRQEPQLLAEGLESRWLAGDAAPHRTRMAAPPVLAPAGSSTLVDLAEGPYLHVAAHLDASALAQVDATCRPLRELNRAHCGSWCTLGMRAFYGIDLDGDGAFQPFEAACSAKHARVDWKGRYARFLAEVRAFRAPFNGPEITEVPQADEIAYSRCKLRTDLLATVPSEGVYIEVEVLANPDNVSLAVVNFDAGGCSSVTFSPDTGAVIRERKICEEPRKVQGSYIQPLTTITHGQGFEGSIGLYLLGGHLAFFRRHVAPSEEGEAELGPWECTGFVTDLAWAEGKELTPCLAFRDEGAYRVRMVCVGSKPPLTPQRAASAYDEASWSDLNWDADQEAEDLVDM